MEMKRNRNRNRLVIVLAALLFIACVCVAGCGKAKTADQAEPEEEEIELTERFYSIEITMQGGGKIVLELDAEAAPITVANFLKLVDAGYYDGLTFHRIIAGFMIQGGCPDGTGKGGPDKRIKGEFADNGWDNPISHVRGVISMARSDDPDSARSQFFITNAGSTFLDGKYAAFGIVTSGMEVVDEITATPLNGEKPIDPPVIESIRRK